MDPMIPIVLSILVCASAQIQQDSLNVDLVIIPHDGAQYHEDHHRVHKRVFGEMLPQTFELGRHKTRAMLLAKLGRGDFFSFTYTWHYSEYEYNAPNWTPQNWTDVVNNKLALLTEKEAGVHELELPVALLKVAMTGPPGNSERPTVVFVSTFPSPDTLRAIPELAKFGDPFETLRERGFIFYFAFRKSNDQARDEESRRLIDAMVYDPSQDVYELPRDTAAFEREFDRVLEWLRVRIRDRYCHFETRCFFKDPKGSCHRGYYTPNALREAGDCAKTGARTPSVRGECPTIDCNRTCDELWNWTRTPPMCGPFVCGDPGIHRVTPKPRWRELDHCAEAFLCRPCPTERTKQTRKPPVTLASGETEELMTWTVPMGPTYPPEEPEESGAADRSGDRSGGWAMMIIWVCVCWFAR